jgi:hypothetical protein
MSDKSVTISGTQRGARLAVLPAVIASIVGVTAPPTALADRNYACTSPDGVFKTGTYEAHTGYYYTDQSEFGALSYFSAFRLSSSGGITWDALSHGAGSVYGPNPENATDTYRDSLISDGRFYTEGSVFWTMHVWARGNDC